MTVTPPTINKSFESTDLLIYGGGGHAKTLIDLVRALNHYYLVGIIDDNLPAGSHVLGAPVLGGADLLPELRERGLELAVNAVGGIGNPEVRWRVFEILLQAGFTCPAIVHPTACVEPTVELDGGVQVLAQSYISSASSVGFGTVINAGVIISHDCKLGRCVNLSPGAALAGGVQVGDFAQLGMNVTVNLNINIGQAARVGNGATVKADVPPQGRVYAGTIWPARPVPRGEDHVS